ncbi:MAG: hypothetical protein A3K10_17425 [Bacteroidetes bacterium RIFCSPLOWO2_12_FULL_31_6]|nr:MAG: hypothetical protein A3K10_17425 [Bacteroidetes bacterium RIFCSPLOWO2_12_FULL_31_6]
MKQLIFFVIIVFLFACSTAEIEQEQNTSLTESENTELDSTSIKNSEDSQVNSPNSNQRIAASNKEFLTFYEKFSTAISKKNATNFNECMDSNFGLYVIESPGALPIISKVYDISKFKSKNNNNNFFELAFNNISSTPIFDELPKVVCEETIYDKNGCFASSINALQESQLLNYSDLNEKEIQAITKLASLVNLTVINTNNYTFYFSFIENKWSISFIDLRIPCQA